MEPLVVYDRATRIQRRVVFASLAALVVAGLLAALHYSGLFALERHTGFFAPTWDSRGEQVFYLQRDTIGLIWGLGREDVSPPAHVYVFSDEISLRRLYIEDGRIEVLRRLDETPVRGRILRNYRGQIFSPLHARIGVRGGGLDFMARIEMPDEEETADGQTSPAMVAHDGYSDNPLFDDIELMTLPGRESYPAAVLAVTGAGEYDVLLSNHHFDRLYPEPLAPDLLRERSRRDLIEHERQREDRVAELMRDFRARGLSKSEVEQRVTKALLDMGYMVVGSRLIASRIDAPDADDRVFTITPGEFDSGLFSDIRKALEQPGKAVAKQQAEYIEHAKYATGRELNAWLAEGNRSFVVRHHDRYYRLLVLH